MLVKIGLHYVAVCSVCGVELHTEQANIVKAKIAAKKAFWAIRNEYGTKMYCPECQMDLAQGLQTKAFKVYDPAEMAQRLESKTKQDHPFMLLMILLSRLALAVGHRDWKMAELQCLNLARAFHVLHDRRY